MVFELARMAGRVDLHKFYDELNPVDFRLWNEYFEMQNNVYDIEENNDDFTDGRTYHLKEQNHIESFLDRIGFEEK